jgi:hypothetical protein
MSLEDMEISEHMDDGSCPECGRDLNDDGSCCDLLEETKAAYAANSEESREIQPTEFWIEDWPHALMAVELLKPGEDTAKILHFAAYKEPPTMDDFNHLYDELETDETFGMTHLKGRSNGDYIILNVPDDLWRKQFDAEPKRVSSDVSGEGEPDRATTDSVEN